MSEVLTGEYTIQDYILANRLHMARSKMWYVMMILVILFLLVAISVVIKRPHDVVSWIFIVFFIVYLGYPYTILPLQSRILFNRQKNVHGKIKVRFEPMQIIERGQLGESTYKWLHHYLVTDKMILLYNTPKTFIMLPRRFFRDDNQFNDIKNYLNSFPTGNKTEHAAQVPKQ